MIKSVFRLGACYALYMIGDPILAMVGVLFGIGEVIGILEEM